MFCFVKLWFLFPFCCCCLSNCCCCFYVGVASESIVAIDVVAVAVAFVTAVVAVAVYIVACLCVQDMWLVKQCELLLLCVIGERSEPLVGRCMINFVFHRMPVCGIHIYRYIYIYVCVPYVHNPESQDCREDFADST